MGDQLLSGEQKLLRDSVRSFVEREVLPHAVTWDQDERYPQELFRRFGEQGWLGIGFPEELGGSGGGALDYALFCREMARGSAAVALGGYVHTALACAGILHLGSEEQKRAFLPAALAGHSIGCWAYAESGAGADVSTVKTRARREGDDYVLSGSKMYITNSPFADFMVVVASTTPEKGLKGMSLFLVQSTDTGVSVGPPMHKLGMGASEMAEIVLDGCRVPLDRRLGPEDYGFLEAMKVLTLGRIASAAFGVGLGTAAFEEASAYTRDRVQFGVPLKGHQFVRFALAEMATRLEAAWHLTVHAAGLVDAEEVHDKEASMAKLFATEACTWVCERALHLCGAQGYMRESAAQRFYRDCKVLELGEGTSEIQRETIARNMEG